MLSLYNSRSVSKRYIASENTLGHCFFGFLTNFKQTIKFEKYLDLKEELCYTSFSWTSFVRKPAVRAGAAATESVNHEKNRQDRPQ